MAILIEFFWLSLSGLVFILSSGIFYRNRHGNNLFLMTIVGIFAIASTLSFFWSLPQLLSSLNFNPGLKPADPVTAFLANNKRQPGVIETASGLQYKILSAGDPIGATPADSDTAYVDYTGTRLDGSLFDGPQKSAAVWIGFSMPGLREGFKLMRAGDQYRFWIKPSLACKHVSGQRELNKSIVIYTVKMNTYIANSILREQRKAQGLGPLISFGPFSCFP